MNRVDEMKILVVSLLYPLPDNVARGTFVADHVQALKKDGHDVRVVNPLPRMMRYQEARRSTLTGTARAPKEFQHGGVSVYAPRYIALPEHPWPNFTARSIRKKTKKLKHGSVIGNLRLLFATPFGQSLH